MKLDFIGSIDSYLVAEFGSARYATEPISNNRNPIYAMKIYVFLNNNIYIFINFFLLTTSKLPYSEPSVNESLRLSIMDYDRGKKDDILGTLVFEKREISQGKFKEICWHDIYGSQSDHTNDFGDLMNNDSNIGAFWKGRILLGIHSFACEKPTFLCENVEQKLVDTYKTDYFQEFFVLAELYHAFSLPKDSGNYYVQLRWADYELNFDEKVSFFLQIEQEVY